jgi:SIR2-like protein
MVALANRDWDHLIRAIKDQRCTPFIGAGACHGTLPLGADIARDWAQKNDYPFDDSNNLIKVAQFLAVEAYPMFPKDEIVQLFKDLNASPKLSEENEPHRVLAELPLPVYLTTNYDDFMMRALTRNKMRDPKREICRWNTLTRNELSRFDNGYEPTVANPVVFHLHGHTELPSSIVLTEDDYFDFLVNVSREPDLIPRRIQKALTETSVLFIGYGLADWNFRVLMQGLSRYMEKGLGRRHIAVMLSPNIPNSEAQQQKAQKYLANYYENIDVQVYWGTAREFCAELAQRWREAI